MHFSLCFYFSLGAPVLGPADEHFRLLGDNVEQKPFKWDIVSVLCKPITKQWFSIYLNHHT